jgi:hypothetical protein
MGMGVVQGDIELNQVGADASSLLLICRRAARIESAKKRLSRQHGGDNCEALLRVVHWETSVNLLVHICMYLKMHFFICPFLSVSDVQVYTDTACFILCVTICSMVKHQ